MGRHRRTNKTVIVLLLPTAGRHFSLRILPSVAVTPRVNGLAAHNGIFLSVVFFSFFLSIYPFLSLWVSCVEEITLHDVTNEGFLSGVFFFSRRLFMRGSPVRFFFLNYFFSYFIGRRITIGRDVLSIYPRYIILFLSFFVFFFFFCSLFHRPENYCSNWKQPCRGVSGGFFFFKFLVLIFWWKKKKKHQTISPRIHPPGSTATGTIQTELGYTFAGSRVRPEPVIPCEFAPTTDVVRRDPRGLGVPDKCARYIRPPRFVRPQYY